MAKASKKLTVLGATSGDTGSAAIDGCKNKESMEVFIFHEFRNFIKRKPTRRKKIDINTEASMYKIDNK